MDSKWKKDLKVWTGSVKLLEENIKGKLHNIGFGNDFIDLIPKAQTTKTKINETTSIKNLQESKRKIQHSEKNKQTECENIFVNHISDKELMLKI